MNRIVIWIALILINSLAVPAQNKLPESNLKKKEFEKHLRYLASDELMGRRTGSPGNDSAAAYIARYFESLGLQPASGTDRYFQKISFGNSAPPSMASFKIGEEQYTQSDNLMVLTGEATTINTNLIFAGHGLVDEKKGWDDYSDLDVSGKVVVVYPGTIESTDPQVIFEKMSLKRRLAEERGAVGIFELYRIPFPWGFFTSYFGRPSMMLLEKNSSKSPTITYGWIKESDLSIMNSLKEGAVELSISGSHSGSTFRQVYSQNVAAVLPGTDPELKEEFVILSAHYDHVGTGKDGGGYYSEQDSIFNGARDNAMGTVALMAAAKALSKQPPKRSVLFLALTGEEIGLLGSQYYVNNPLIPLDKCIFNINTDGAGYNDITKVSVIGFGRTGTDEEVTKGAESFGLGIIPNPVPQQNLYDRSDNVSFAKAGIPAINVSPGVSDFDEVITKNYHQVTDEADTVDFKYLLKYCQTVSLITRNIANSDTKPFWKPGDKYEAAGIQLYQK